MPPQPRSVIDAIDLVRAHQLHWWDGKELTLERRGRPDGKQPALFIVYAGPWWHREIRSGAAFAEDYLRRLHKEFSQRGIVNTTVKGVEALADGRSAHLRGPRLTPVQRAVLTVLGAADAEGAGPAAIAAHQVVLDACRGRAMPPRACVALAIDQMRIVGHRRWIERLARRGRYGLTEKGRTVLAELLDAEAAELAAPAALTGEQVELQQPAAAP